MPQVKDIITGYPEFLANYSILTSNIYTSKFGDVYQVLAITQYDHYSDIICTPDNKYVRTGSEIHSETLEIIEQLSLLLECDRTIHRVSTTSLIA